MLITQRLDTVQLADRVYVVEDGRITGSGAHEDLLTGSGTYARLFSRQADTYR